MSRVLQALRGAPPPPSIAGHNPWGQDGVKARSSADIYVRTFRAALGATIVVVGIAALGGLARPLLAALLTQAFLTAGALAATRRGWARPASIVTAIGLLALPWWPGVGVDPEALGLATLVGPVAAVVVAAATLPVEGAVAIAALALASAMLLGLQAPLPPALKLAFPVALAGLGVVVVGVHGAVTWELRRLRGVAVRQDSLLDELQLAAEGAHVGLWHWNLATGLVHLSARAEEMLGLPGRGAHAEEEWLSTVDPGDATRLQAELSSFIQRSTPATEVRFRIAGEGDEPRWVLLRAAASREGSRAVRLGGSITDVTQWTHSEARLRESAYHDALTRLPNRTLMLDRLAQAFACAQHAPGTRFAVMFLDLDGFKLINDAFGHSVGDELLQEVARRLERCVRPCDTVARLGGDEFLVLLENLSTVEEAEQVAGRVLSRLRPVVRAAGQELQTAASIGVAMGPGSYTHPEELIRDADTAMYRAKSMGKGRFCLFDVQMRDQVVARLTLERELQVAVDQNEFQLYYQPIVTLADRKIIGFEALIRWPRGARSPVGPGVFIPVAEENGLIVPISWWVIETAAACVAGWRANLPGAEDIWVQVNINADVLKQPNLAATIMGVVARHGLDPSALRFELTETAVIEPGGAARAVLEELRKAGFEVHLDDFGTGYSSLSYLYRYPVDGLKIDREFIRQLDDAARPGLVDPILQIARSLGLSVTAEGIETERQLRVLAQLGCPRGQGFFFSPGVPEGEAAQMLTARPRW